MSEALEAELTEYVGIHIQQVERRLRVESNILCFSSRQEKPQVRKQILQGGGNIYNFRTEELHFRIM